MNRPPGLTAPQWALLQEIDESGTLYITRGKRYERTVDALWRRGLVYRSEPDHSRNGIDGWAIAPTKEESV